MVSESTTTEHISSYASLAAVGTFVRERNLFGPIREQVEELKPACPDLYAHSAPYYLEWQIADALAAGQIDRLAYHGHLALLAETMARGWPLVRESDKYLPAERRADVLRDLGKLVAQAEPIWAQRPSDPALAPNIRAAWERATKT